ncbi:conserved hypothetical protein [Streptomyces sp. SPB78]|nr:conserved hypothetical protein [Streptomyces sp. SPB78]
MLTVITRFSIVAESRRAPGTCTGRTAAEGNHASSLCTTTVRPVRWRSPGNVGNATSRWPRGPLFPLETRIGAKRLPSFRDVFPTSGTRCVRSRAPRAPTASGERLSRPAVPH